MCGAFPGGGGDHDVEMYEAVWGWMAAQTKRFKPQL